MSSIRILLAVALLVPPVHGSSLECPRALTGPHAVFEAAVKRRLREANIDLRRLFVEPPLDLTFVPREDRVQRRILEGLSVSPAAGSWSLFEIVRAAGTVATTVSAGEFVQFVNFVVEEMLALSPESLTKVEAGALGLAQSREFVEAKSGGRLLYVRERHSIPALPGAGARPFEALILGLPDAFFLPVVLHDYRIGETDALVVVRDEAGTILGVAPFRAGYQLVVQQIARRHFEELHLRAGGNRLRDDMAVTDVEIEAHRGSGQDLAFAEWQLAHPLHPPTSYPGEFDRSRLGAEEADVRKSQRQSLELMVGILLFGPVFVLAPLAVSQTLDRDVFRYLGYAYFSHVGGLLLSDVYRKLMLKVAQGIGLVRFVSLPFRGILRSWHERATARARQLEILRERRALLDEWHRRYRERLAEPIGAPRDRLWEPTRPTLRAYWTEEEPAMQAYEATGVRLIFRRIEEMNLNATLEATVLALMRSYSVDYWKAVVAADRVLVQWEGNTYGRPLTFREAFGR